MAKTKHIDAQVPEKRNEKVAIIGGGLAGIISTVMLKEERFDPIVFEKSDLYGGTWSYREESTIGTPSTMRSTTINHSKEIGAFSTFPPNKEYSNFMRHAEVNRYMEDFMSAFDVHRHIRINHEVTSVRRADDYDATGRWIVDVQNTITGEKSSDIYDRVIVSVGQFNRPKIPTYPGQDTFKGQIMHTHSLKSVEELKEKTVLVVGMGCSALDAATESSAVAKQVYLSTRSGATVINRLSHYGYPVDYVIFRRFLTNGLDWFPSRFCSWVVQKFFIDPKYDLDLYKVKPKYHLLAKDPVLNDQIGSKLQSGAVKQKRDVVKFTDSGVVFNGEEDKEVDIDVVIMGTGYEWKFPFLEEGVLSMDKESGRIDLYKCIFPTQLKHSTLAFIGFILPFGPGFPLGELQARYAALVFSGARQLPPEQKRAKDAQKRLKTNSARYLPNDKMSIRVDHVQYMDELAKKIGCKPNLFKTFFVDPSLYFKLYYGPCVSYQYRLKGPHKWSEARKTIFTVKERTHYPLRGSEKN